MSNNIRLKKGLDIPVAGQAALQCERTVIGDVVAVSGCEFRALVPRLLVKEGDSVLCGTPVLADKKRPEILFTSPVSGTVKAVVRGEKRKLIEVQIQTDGQQAAIDFGKKDIDALMLQTTHQSFCSADFFHYKSMT